MAAVENNHPNGSSEVSSIESFTGSWIQLDAKNGSSLHTSPIISDAEEMEEVLADAQTEADRGTSKDKNLEEEKEPLLIKDKESVSEWMLRNENSQNENNKNKDKRKSNRMSLRGSRVISGVVISGDDVKESNILYISTLLFTHSVALLLGVYLGKKFLSPNRAT